MNELKSSLLSAMESAGFARMTTSERYRFLADFLMRYFAAPIEAARRRPEMARTAYYLSAEFLMGRMIHASLYNLRLLDTVREAMAELDSDLAELEEVPDHALGNGGLGRLAACFLDSAATHRIPLWGYGIRYRYGLFRQRLENGYQEELPDNWLRMGDPWSIRRDSECVAVTLGRRRLRAVPYDMPVFGYSPDGAQVTLLRLWQAESEEPFDFSLFDAGRYAAASARDERDGRISRVLYPNDSTPAGRELRLSQELFFTEASVADILRRFAASHGEDYTALPRLTAIQLNDTHPAAAIPALIGQLEERGVPFAQAAELAREIFSYTNHTVMAEALEVWEADLYRRLSPRGWRVIERIQRMLEEECAQRGTDRSEMNIIADGRVHMARLAAYMSRTVNGVAALHTEILRTRVLAPWEAAFPGKIQNKTNGITPRRWLGVANPALADFVTERVGDGWITDAARLEGLGKYVSDGASLDEFARIKAENKRRLAAQLERQCGLSLDPAMLLDVQIKRLHEYKRQLMNAFSILRLYSDIREGAAPDVTPTAFLFGAKAAPGYYMAKAIIRFILAIAERVNGDPAVRDRMQVIFVPDYSVSWAERIVAAAELSEQISAAGTEASGTGNMKLMMNGAPTLGTYDGANLEILEAAGAENNFFFGPRAEEMAERMREYDPRRVLEGDAQLARAVDSLIDGTLDDGGSGCFAALHASLTSWDGRRPDPYCVLGDFAAYTEAKGRAMAAYRDTRRWAAMGLANTAAAGRFSSDRTVREYAEEIWRV